METPGPLAAYIAGAAAFAAPCTLVLLPFFVLFVAAMVVMGPGEGRERRVSGAWTVRWMALGFIVAFVISWSFPDAAPTVLRWLRGLERFGGLALVAYGLWLTGLLGVLGGVRGMRDPRATAPLSTLVGATLAAGWTPCVGATLSTILGMAGGPEASSATILLIVYAIGLMTPFIGLGWGTERILLLTGRPRLPHPGLTALGAVVIGMGIIVFTGFVREVTAYAFSLWPGLAL